jgi:hypothetical protein
MGSPKYRNVGESQSVLIMINSMISPRTRIVPTRYYAVPTCDGDARYAIGALIGNVEGKACLVGTLAIKDKLAADRIAAEIHDIAAGAMGT